MVFECKIQENMEIKNSVIDCDIVPMLSPVVKDLYQLVITDSVRVGVGVEEPFVCPVIIVLLKDLTLICRKRWGKEKKKLKINSVAFSFSRLKMSWWESDDTLSVPELVFSL